MVLVRVRRGLHAPTSYLDVSGDIALQEVIPEVPPLPPCPASDLTLPRSTSQLCKQLAMFDAEDINLYRCPQNPSVRRCSLSATLFLFSSQRPLGDTALSHSGMPLVQPVHA